MLALARISRRPVGQRDPRESAGPRWGYAPRTTVSTPTRGSTCTPTRPDFTSATPRHGRTEPTVDPSLGASVQRSGDHRFEPRAQQVRHGMYLQHPPLLLHHIRTLPAEYPAAIPRSTAPWPRPRRQIRRRHVGAAAPTPHPTPRQRAPRIQTALRSDSRRAPRLPPPATIQRPSGLERLPHRPGRHPLLPDRGSTCPRRREPPPPRVPTPPRAAPAPTRHAARPAAASARTAARRDDRQHRTPDDQIMGV